MSSFVELRRLEKHHHPHAGVAHLLGAGVVGMDFIGVQRFGQDQSAGGHQSRSSGRA